MSSFSYSSESNGPPSSSTYFTAPTSLSSLSALGFSTANDSTVFNPRSPSLGSSSFDVPPVRQVESRAYPPVERRSFRDVSSAGDVVVGGYDAGMGSGATSRGRSTPTVGHGIGAIGDGRKQSSPEKDEQAQAQSHVGGVFDARGALGSSSSAGYATGPLASQAHASAASPSRPLSFIAIPPPRSASQSTGTAPDSRDDADLGAAQAATGITSSTLFHSPTSTSGPGLPATSSASRASSPAPGESYASGSLTYRVSELESTLIELSAIIHGQMVSLRDEVGVLRGLVLQSNNFTGGPRLPAQVAPGADRAGTDSPRLTVRSPSPHHSPAFPDRSIQHQHSLSSLNLQPLPSPHLTGPPSPALSAPGSFFQDRAPEERARFNSNSDGKDDEIRALHAQIASLSSTVSQLIMVPGNLPPLSQSPLLGGGLFGGPPQNQMPVQLQQQLQQQKQQQLQQQQQQQQHRQHSLPPLGSHQLGSPSLVGSPGFGSLGEGWKREVGAGLGVSTPSGPGGARSPLLRPLSANGSVGSIGGLGGQNRQPSLGSTFGRPGDDDRRRSQLGYGPVGLQSGNIGQPFDSPGSTWDSGSMNGMPGSPLPGLAGAGNPPGSLGGKWEALGIGNELFRTIAKYGLGPPTKIQSKAIPCVLRYQDIVSQAPSIQERIQSYVVPALQMVCSAAAQATLDGGSPAPKGIQIIIVTATVDQAAQAQRLSVGLGGSLGIRTSLCVGQGDLQQDLQTFLKAPPHVLVGTPQRLLDLFNLRTLPVADIRLLVVDECDQLIARNLADFVTNLARLLPPSGPGVNPPHSPSLSRSPMLGGGAGLGMQLPGAFETTPRFADSPRFPSTSSSSSALTSSTANGPLSLAGGAPPEGRQTIIFSCTVPQDVLNFASSLQLREPVRVLVRREGGESSSPSVRGLRQFYLYIAVGASTKSKGIGAVGRREASTAREWKLEALADLCEEQAFDTCVIFCGSVDGVEAVSYKLGTRGIEALALHQDMGQSARHAIMTKFRAAPGSRPGSNKRALVVYDALTRSLTDLNSVVPLVINYDLPRAVEDYVHRISCASTSGYGRPGIAINIVTPGTDVEMLRSIETFYRCKIAELPGNFSTAA